MVDETLYQDMECFEQNKFEELAGTLVEKGRKIEDAEDIPAVDIEDGIVGDMVGKDG